MICKKTAVKHNFKGMPNGWKGSEIWRKIIWGIYYFRLFKSHWGSIAGSNWQHYCYRGQDMGGDHENGGRPALRRRTSCVLTPDVRQFCDERSAETKSETWNIILARARIIYHRFHNHVSCFILFQKPFVDAVFRVKHDVSSWFTKIFMFHHEFDWIVFNFSLINLTQ